MNHSFNLSGFLSSLFAGRKWKPPLLYGLPILLVVYDLLDDIWMHLL